MKNELVPVQEAPQTEVGAVSAVAREQSEIQAQMIVAKKFARNEMASYAKMMRSFERPTMAESAEYVFPRGGKSVRGPSVDTAREMARCWGNLRYGVRIVSIDDEHIHIKGYAHDLESNAYQESEDKFKKLVQRRTKEGASIWITPDERDLRELINRRGAICERNALLKILPPDMVEDVVRRAREICEKAAAGELEQSREEGIRRLTLAFDRIGVSTAMLQNRLGHGLDTLNAQELSELRGVYKSIVDGNSTREEHFEGKREEATAGANELNDSLKHVRGKAGAVQGATKGAGDRILDGTAVDPGLIEETPLEKAKKRVKEMKSSDEQHQTPS